MSMSVIIVLRVVKTERGVQLWVMCHVFGLPFLDASRTDEKENSPLRRVNPVSSLLWCLPAEDSYRHNKRVKNKQKANWEAGIVFN